MFSIINTTNQKCNIKFVWPYIFVHNIFVGMFHEINLSPFNIILIKVLIVVDILTKVHLAHVTTMIVAFDRWIKIHYTFHVIKIYLL
jgi:hypothetical protein